MHVPVPVANQVKGPGKIFTTGFAVATGIVAFLVYCWVGLAIFGALLAALLIAELWVESSRLTEEIRTRDTALRTLGDERDAATIDNRELERRVGRVAELEGEVVERDEYIEQLQTALREPSFSTEQLLEALQQHVSMLNVAQRHRTMRREDSAAWPVVRVNRVDDDTIGVQAVVGEGAERLIDEVVLLVDDQGTASLPGVVVEAGSRNVHAAFNQVHVPMALADELEESGSFSPTGHALRLAGASLFPGVTEEAIADLRDAVLALSDKLMLVLMPATSPDGPENAADLGDDER